MSVRDTSYLIELAKQAPTELAKQEVLGFIQTIPTLPPPSNNWFQNFNLNSIIMTTTAITLITSAVIYFSMPSTPEEPSGPEPQVTPPMVEIIDSIEVTPEIEFKHVEIDTIQEEIVTVETTTTIDPVPEEPETPQKTTDLGITVEKITRKNPTVSDAGSRNTRPSTRRFFTVDKEEEEFPVFNQFKLTPSQLRRLKRQLLGLLREDNIDESGIASFSTLWYTAEYLMLNDDRLKGEMLTRYLSVLQSFNITPGPNRRVVVNNDFIQVGDFTDKGFDGQAIGKNMDIYFIENDKKGLFSKNTDRKSSLMEDGDDDIILQTMGEFKHSTVNISEVDRLLESRGNSKPKDGNRFYDSGKSSLSIYTKRTENSYVELNGEQLRALKKELYKELVRDKLVRNKKADVRLLFHPDGITLNDTKLTEQLSFSYQNILEKYDITPTENRKILICTDFILVGDFQKGNFYGSLQGSLNSPDLKKSVFRKDFEDFPVFGFAKAMRKK